MQLKKIINPLITITLLCFLYTKVDISEFKALIPSIKLMPYAISLLAFIFCIVLMSLRLQVLLSANNLFPLKWPRLFIINVISFFYGLFMPSDIGVAAARWYKVTNNKKGKRFFIIVTLLERLMLTTTLLALTVIPLYFVNQPEITIFKTAIMPLLVTTLALSILVFSTFSSTHIHYLLSRVCISIQNKISVNKTIRSILGFHEDLAFFANKKTVLAKAGFVHLLFLILVLFRLYFIFLSLDVQLPLLSMIWVSMLVLLALTIPLSFAGIGIRETGFAFLLSIYGIEPEKGALLGSLLFSHGLIVAFIGGIINLFESK